MKLHDDRVSAAPRPAAGDSARVAPAGRGMVVCDRSDGAASFGRPSARRPAEAASSHETPWIRLLFGGADATVDQARAVAAAVHDAAGPAVAFRRIGHRPALLRARAEAWRGAEPDAAGVTARAAGFDRAPQRERIAACAPRGAGGGAA